MIARKFPLALFFLCRKPPTPQLAPPPKAPCQHSPPSEEFRKALPWHGLYLGYGGHRSLYLPGSESGRGQRPVFGKPAQIWVQHLGIFVTLIFSFGLTFLVAKLLDLSIGLRVTPLKEEVGHDICADGERAYS